MQIRIHQIGPGMVQWMHSICMECQGHGECISPKDWCKNCTGRKIVREKKILEVHIDKDKGFTNSEYYKIDVHWGWWFVFFFLALKQELQQMHGVDDHFLR